MIETIVILGTISDKKHVILILFLKDMIEAKRTILTYQKKFGNTAKKDRRNRNENTDAGGIPVRTDLLMSSYNAWNSLAQWRKDIMRNEEFVWGDQYADKVFDYKNQKFITERQMFVEQGLQPSQYNIIRNILRTIVGVWSSNKTLPFCVAQKDENQIESEMLTATLHTIYRKNELWKLDTAELIQLLVSGAMITKNHYANREGDSDVVNDYISPFQFFVDNSMTDPRYKDCTLVGCFYDLSINEIASKFSKGSKERAVQIRNLYGYSKEDYEERILLQVQTFTDSRLDRDFYMPSAENWGLGRVVEMWRKESAECFWVHDWLNGKYYPDYEVTETQLKAENERRIIEQTSMGVKVEDMLLLEWEWGSDNFWRYYYLTPFGDVLDSGINPYWHEQPPIVFEFHEFYIGKIYPFVKDLIDANKQINKLSAISELLTRYSAKSLTLFPIESVAEAEGYGLDYVENKITDYDAIIPYRSKTDGGSPNPAPTHINTIGAAFTPLNVVNMYLRLSENVSGVFGALQGQQPTAGTPAMMYAQQSQNSSSSLIGIFDAVNSFRTRRDKMNVQLMQQFYDSKRYIFDKDKGRQLIYDPDRVRNIEVEISITENTNTPAYRLMVNDMLFQLKQYDPMNQIDLKGLVEVGNLPFKDKLLDYLNKRDQKMKQAQQQGQPYQGQPLPQDLQQGLSQYQFSPELQQEFSKLDPETQNLVMQQAQQAQQN